MREGYKIIDKISVPSSFESLSDVEALIDNVCNRLMVNEDNYGNVLIAVTEAVNNAILHGNRHDNTLEVNVAVGDEIKSFCFSVKDSGPGFNYSAIPDPTSPENISKENGRGIFLMKNLADEVEFESNGSVVNIYFNK